MAGVIPQEYGTGGAKEAGNDGGYHDLAPKAGTLKKIDIEGPLRLEADNTVSDGSLRSLYSVSR